MMLNKLSNDPQVCDAQHVLIENLPVFAHRSGKEWQRRIFPWGPPAARPPIFSGQESQRLFPAPGQVRKNGDQKTLKPNPHKKNERQGTREGPRPPFSQGNLKRISTDEMMQHDLRWSAQWTPPW
jgi:hypothetical protein